MDDSEKLIGVFALPYGREAIVKDVVFDSGMNLLRLTLKEGRRITIVDLDIPSVRQLAGTMLQWADNAADPANPAPGDNRH